VIFTGHEENVPVASCLVLLFGRKAFYRMAATGSKGREMSASYAMVYRLLEYLQAQGIRQFDFGGIAPGSPTAEGVNYFKRGFGGEMVEHLGEWEWSNSMWLRLGMNLAVRLRGIRL
jgi:lipid II:glycine glycyltransferase (peptidoglycan interpeptide bridge formation enzyme)